MTKILKNSLMIIFVFSLGVISSGCTNQKEAETTTELESETKEVLIQAEPLPSESENSEDMRLLRAFALEDVAKHNTPEDCWMVINGKVYDVTEFIASGDHDPMIAKGCGLDATKLFEGQAKHDKDSVRDLRETFEIGVLLTLY